MMVRHVAQRTDFGILLVRSFPLARPRFQEAQQVPEPGALRSTADRLRWYRLRRELLQRQVADFAGVDRSTYIHYEEANRDYYPVDKLGKIAQLLEVRITDLMDDYNLFLYQGQGRQIRERRQALGLTLPQYARSMGVRTEKLSRWENNQARISKTTWEKYFK